MRKLATIQRISAIHPIPGADKIVRADVLGWEVVVGLDEFKVGDFAVYLEIDTWCDSTIAAFNTPVFQPRFSNWNDPEGKARFGMRLKTIKLRKQLSQGLLMPISAFPELGPAIRNTVEGEDVTELLKLEKWEPYEEQKSNAGGINKEAGARMFPSFIRKTDQERVQNYICELRKHEGETFEVTIKLDGSSMTVYRVGSNSPHYAHVVEDIEKRLLRGMGWFKRTWWKITRRLGMNNPPEQFFGVCSRNIQLDPEGGSHFADYVKKHAIFDKMDKLLFLQENIALQGELIAPSIQKNHEDVKDYEFYVFDVFDIDKQEYLLPNVARAIVRSLGLKYVPVLQTDIALGSYGTDPKSTVDGILLAAEGPGMNPGVKREGIVFKSNSTPFSFKAISNSYLLKKG